MSKINVLLWSFSGSGDFYNGPGMSAYRLFKKDENSRFNIDLVHHNSEQVGSDLYRNVFYIPRAKFKVLNYIPFCCNPSVRWVQKNIHKYDLIYGLTGMTPVTIPAYIAKKNGVPSVVKIAKAQSDLQNVGLKKWLGAGIIKRYYLKKVSKIVGISYELMNELADAGFDKPHSCYIPNGVDVDLFIMKTEEEKRAYRKIMGFPDKFTIIFVGALFERKRPHWLVEVAERMPEINVVLIGPQREKKYYQYLKKKEYELDNLKIIEFSNEIEKYYQAADAFVLPSTNEGLSNAMLEAMSSGLPVLVSKISGSADVVADVENGFFIQSVDDIYYIIDKLKTNPEMKYSIAKEARNTILKKYSHEVILDAYSDLFNSVIRE